jgi:hypothetical protein
MSEHDPNETLREFREYFARSYESQKKIAARVGVTQATFLDLLTCQRQPKPTTLAKLQTFLEAEAKPEGGGGGVRPIEHVPYKVIKPIQQVRYTWLCPFCRKARGKIQSADRNKFQGVCPTCGASGPKRDSHQEALRAGNGREMIEWHRGRFPPTLV